MPTRRRRDPYDSADQAALRIEKRLRRYKSRLKGHHARTNQHKADEPSTIIAAPSYVIAAPEHESDDEITDFNPVIIAEATTALKAALGQRGGDGTRPDRHPGRGFSSCRTRAH